MHDDLYSFDEPLNREPDGTYITAAQMKFFLNRKNGIDMYEKKSRSFVEYYDICRVYNLISGIMEKDESAAKLYWNEEEGSVSIAFPDEGKAARALDRIKPHSVRTEIRDEDADPWGVEQEPPWSD